jgi:3-oxoacyl-[acyl-carrier protein] reductase
MDLGLAGATVCIQGGSKGIGYAAAQRFAAEGARIVLLARNTQPLEDAVTELCSIGSPDAFGIPADVGSADSIASAFDQITQRWGELNILVCAAGPEVSHLPWHTVSDDRFVDSFVLGALSAVRCARGANALMRAAQWARIVNVSAMSSRCQGPGLIDYSAAKAALTSITKNLSIELGDEGILVNTVSPGTVITDQLSRYIAALPTDLGVSADDPESVMHYITEAFGVRSDLGRAGLPDEIASVICFLASRANSYMTGANINVDGGSAFYA